ncbi:MAG: class I SAM-dependent methyltransferase [Candidatus Omnitrophica bacterium]|nr:class I SAM-dependent methyltransferase [Candidatus Omnitrophota bacterium]
MKTPGITAFHTLLYFLKIHEAHTQTTQKEREALSKYSSGKKKAVEIGVYEGVNTRIIAQHLDSQGVLYAVDPFFRGRIGICWNEFIARGEIRRGKVKNVVQFVHATSHEATQTLKGQFDFIFIDADHSYEGIKSDWEDWSPRIEKEGIIALHDTQVPDHDASIAQLGSYRFFQEHIRQDARFEILKQTDSLSILKRK